MFQLLKNTMEIFLSKKMQKNVLLGKSHFALIKKYKNIHSATCQNLLDGAQ